MPVMNGAELAAKVLDVLHHDVGDSGRGEGGWGLVSDGGVGSVVVVVDEPPLEVVGALGFSEVQGRA